MAIPRGQLTRKQIVDRALRKAGNTALSSGPDYEAQIWLNQILFDLYCQFDWPFLRATTSLTIQGAGTGFTNVSTPNQFLRPLNDTPMVIQQFDGVAMGGIIREIDRRTYDLQRSAMVGATGSIPEVFTVIYETNLLSFLPDLDPAHTTTADFVYQFLPTVLATDPSDDNTIITFPWHDYLIQALYVATLEYENDGRADTEAGKREGMLMRIRNITFPSRSGEPTIPLDAGVFGVPYRSNIDYGWLR